MAMGRPREFDIERALDRALEVFWRNGYEGASIASLTEAMGINPPSLYAAFGNKEGLFRRALDRYVQQRTGFWNEATRCADGAGNDCPPAARERQFSDRKVQSTGMFAGAGRAVVQ